MPEVCRIGHINRSHSAFLTVYITPFLVYRIFNYPSETSNFSLNYTRLHLLYHLKSCCGIRYLSTLQHVCLRGTSKTHSINLSVISFICLPASCSSPKHIFSLNRLTSFLPSSPPEVPKE